MKLWDTQLTSLANVRGLIAEGKLRRICLTSPTGGGKSLCIFEMTQWGMRTLILHNRAMLGEQYYTVANEYGIEYGVQAAGYAEDGIERNVQIGSIQTIYRRWKTGKMHLWPAQLLIIDEIHNETGTRVDELIEAYLKMGAIVVVVTATPLNIGHLVDALVIAGTTTELRECGALVKCYTYAPDEPDWRAFKKERAKILQLREEAREAMLPIMFGRSIEHWRQLTPDWPTLLFAMDVAASRYFAMQYFKAGVPAAHIDAERIWINGETMPANRANRELLRDMAESGDVKVVTNRFVMREGIDWPFLRCVILACTFGSLKAYIQAGGRVLRAHPGKDHAIVLDHGSNYWKHDSLNCDREWRLDKTERQMNNERYENYRTGAAPEPIVCCKCKLVRRYGVECPRCHYIQRGRTRVVIQTDGTLRQINGDVFRPRKVSAETDELKKAWISCVCRCRNAKRAMTMSQARALFMREHGWAEPHPDWPFIPKRSADWFRHISSVFPKKEKANADQ